MINSGKNYGIPLKRYLKVSSGEMISFEEETDEGFPIIGGNGIRAYTTKFNTEAPSLVIGRVGAQCGNVHLIEVPFWASEHAFVVHPRREFDLKFGEYMISSLNLNTKAIKTAQPLLNTTLVEETIGYFPPLEMQKAIAKYLDNETNRIDNLINQKQEQLHLLAEKRQALITQAVTKGINSKAKLKDSGIDWLGEIPNHWNLKKVKYLTSKVGSGVTPKGGAIVYQKTGIPLLRSQNIRFEGLDLEDVAFITEEMHESMASSKVYTGDVLINITGASIGRCYFYSGEYGEANVNQHVCILRPNGQVLTKYLYLLLSSNIGQSQVKLHQVGGGREGLTFESLKAFVFPLPNFQEQQEILSHVKELNDEIILLEESTKKSINLLKERRSALITAAVTGQVQIPS